ncbi:DegT/DnrJ/EryC1/StrS family aminotransferase [Goodfellowiella coeruleoviolacea]|uniref:dTDP-4-amino-4,6-dideoxygalactose transaminase n=1 Tax=Goodfellowiella coeruleoviolacea TaxID=334858 RepID=A0AAE3GET0_9PSEU|nr:DegT/DnrJ/EryC1/StrS family aminotransferase [Goodfellowiella coeruleoviolacea]MCP2166891.1 dTDP-4-amino-4,6-dideoxygalactose transaminase [Goodfellowiella coeruleoviolacea]
MSDQLAMFGGRREVARAENTRERTGWPVVTEAEREAVLGVFDAGLYTSNDGGRGAVSGLQRDWAAYTGVRFCAAVANGTAALELSLAALGLEPGAEVLVPALTFIGSAIPVVRRLLVPVFVDVDPVTYTIDPAAAEAAITPRTRAIIAVHLHGLPADLTALRALADKHGLHLVEDAAQAQGARYRGRAVASFGDINAVSLNVVKNLPTCGEGGLVTTDDEELHERVVLHRQFGEDLRAGRDRDYISRVLAGNEKLSAVQAAFTRAQLSRLDANQAARDRGVRAFLARLAELPGVITPHCPPDRTHAWHILRLRFDPAAAGLPDVRPGAFRAVLARALKAEGVPVQPYQVVPLPGQPAFQRLAGFGGYPWRLPGVAPVSYRIEDHPVSLAVIEDSLTVQRVHLNPAAAPLLLRFADAFAKVWANLDVLAPVARAVDYRPPWQAATTTAVSA